MSNPAGGSDDLQQRLIDGDPQALADLFSRHRERLWRIVNFRLDQRLAGRVDPEDILQEAYLDAAQRIQHYRDDSPASSFLWLRMIVTQTMIDLHRRHLGAQRRDARREVSGDRGFFPACHLDVTGLAVPGAPDVAQPSGDAGRIVRPVGAGDRADGSD